MQKLTNDILLYHGSYCEVQMPDLQQCSRYKDFGQGFYLTTSLSQAANFAKISVKKAKANGIIDISKPYGIVSYFRFHQKKELKIYLYLNGSAL